MKEQLPQACPGGAAGEPCGKRARRARLLVRFFQDLRALIKMVGEERQFASVPLATCLYGL